MQPDARDTQPGSDDGTEPSAPTVARMEDEIAHLRREMSSHAGIDQAVGVILTMGRMTPAEALDALREVSASTGVRADRLARMLIDFPRTGTLPAAVRQELERQVVLRRAPDER
ncbi:MULTISPECIES: ANTAR domain-containing protein [unclassified Streptomyces]|uniref:ANTAR domain-containing protein n=1 Tax=unclassified Streptomyces TaxID=2593676 RepID=UPI000DBA821E|nr:MULTISPECIES: ANTAR domain-containing protein [unclassified Streptomyces]MYT75531.1 ANTAR domain-containing protein [Streptomyces sp. SID8367]RAJ86937.1 ANTAR domain-containing protein [Streptomyces sp. PsTaAH-137]